MTFLSSVFYREKFEVGLKLRLVTSFDQFKEFPNIGPRRLNNYHKIHFSTAKKFQSNKKCQNSIFNTEKNLVFGLG